MLLEIIWIKDAKNPRWIINPNKLQTIDLFKKVLFKGKLKIRIEDKKYQFAGKTGTSQVKRITEAQRELDLDISQIPYEDRDHALYIAFGPYKNPRYAMSVFIEHGGSGGSTAAPMAKKLFKVIIDRHEEREEFKQKNINFLA